MHNIGNNTPPSELEKQVSDIVLLSPDPVSVKNLVEHFECDHPEKRNELEYVIDCLAASGICQKDDKKGMISPDLSKCRSDIAPIAILEAKNREKGLAKILGLKHQTGTVSLSAKQIGTYNLRPGQEHVAILRRNSQGTGLNAKIIPPELDQTVYLLGDIKANGAVQIYPLGYMNDALKRNFSDTVISPNDQAVAPGTYKFKLNKAFNPDAPVLEIDEEETPRYLMLARQNGLSLAPSFKAQKEVRNAKGRVKEKRINSKNRLDFNEEASVIFTADPFGADIYDDALSIRKDGSDIVVDVFILDAAAWVAEGSVIDKEARKQGESLYFRRGEVLPLYPSKLSKQMSLDKRNSNPARRIQTRYAQDGAIKDQNIAFGFVKPTHNFSYEEFDAARFRMELPNTYAIEMHYEMLRHTSVGSLMPARKAARSQEDVFTAREAPFGQIYTAMNMLEANTYQAETMYQSGMPGLYRIHNGNDDHLLVKRSLDLLRSLQYDVPHKPDQITRDVVQDIRAQAEQRGHTYFVRHIIQENLIGGGVYSNNPSSGHLDLNLARYTHATSDGRRYSDTTIGRILHAILPGGDPDCALSEKGFEDLPDLAEELNTLQVKNRQTAYDYSRYFAAQSLEQSFRGKDISTHLMRIKTNHISLFHPTTRYRLDIANGELNPDHWRVDQAAQTLWYRNDAQDPWYPILTNDPVKVMVEHVDTEKGDHQIKLVSPETLSAKNSRQRRGELASIVPAI